MPELKIELRCSICNTTMNGNFNFGQRRLIVEPCKACFSPVNTGQRIDDLIKQLVNVLEVRRGGMKDEEKAS